MDHGGEIIEAVSSMIWPGEAVVHVSIVNWVKGKAKGKKRLYIQEGNDVSTGWRHQEFDTIGPSLSFDVEVSTAKSITVNSAKGGCFQGQTHGHKYFLMKANDAKLQLLKNPEYQDVLFPFLIADDLIGEINSKPTRYVIDFGSKNVLEAKRYSGLYERVESYVLPDRKAAAEKEAKKNQEAAEANPKAKAARDHEMALNTWWQLFRPRAEMLRSITALPRYIVCGRVTKRPIFEFVSPAIHPNDALQVFAFADDYSFGILQSDFHWTWFTGRCSTLKSDFRYTSNTVYDSFPWPQKPDINQIKKVAAAAKHLRELRTVLRIKHRMSLRELYRSLELPGSNPLRDAHQSLDKAVASAYGIDADADKSTFLLDLNARVIGLQEAGEAITAPGLPPIVKDATPFISDDCLLP